PPGWRPLSACSSTRATAAPRRRKRRRPSASRPTGSRGRPSPSSSASCRRPWPIRTPWLAPSAWPRGCCRCCGSGRRTSPAAWPDLDNPELPAFLRNHPDRPRPLKPTAEQCFERSLKIAPDVLETHTRLVQLYRDQRKAKKAEQAARQLLERFPDHVPTLE